MKKQIAMALVMLVWTSYGLSQTLPLKQEWATFHQTVNFKTDGKYRFHLSAKLNGELKSDNASMAIVMELRDKDGKRIFSEQSTWPEEKGDHFKTVVIEGYLTEDTSKITFGGLVVGEGNFFFDQFKLQIENIEGEFLSFPISNSDFERPVIEQNIPDWYTSIDGSASNAVVKGYSFETRGEEGNSYLVIIGSDIHKDDSYRLLAHPEYTPQIGALVAMLENLKDRVENMVRELNQAEIDHLLDDKANSIGALIFHLAAAEKYYQVATFENRGFTKEESDFWQIALDLGEGGRESIKGHPVSYYLNLYNEVRKKTLMELKQRDDEWLVSANPGKIMNNYFGWFHVMEHQSGHLAQIKMLMKRLPEEEMPLNLEDKVKG